MRSRSHPSPRVLLFVASLAMLAMPARAGAQDAGGFVIEPGREAEVVALFAPHALGGEVVDGWRLSGIEIRGDHIRAVARSSDGAEGALVLRHRDATSSSRRSTSFALAREGDPRAAPALDALATAVERNDRTPFWQVRATARPLTSSTWLDGTVIALLGLALLLALVVSQLREAPRWVGLGLACVVAAGAVLRIVMSPVTALGVWPYTRMLRLGALVFEGPVLGAISDAGDLRIPFTEVVFALNLVIAILTPIAIYAHAHYVLRDPRAALACAALLAFFPNHIRFSHSEVEFVLSLALSSTTLAVLHAALVDPSRARRIASIVALPFVLYASVVTRELNILLVPLGLAAALMLRGGSDRRRLAIVLVGLAIGAALGGWHLAVSYSEQVRDGLGLQTIANSLQALVSVRHNTLINPRVTPLGVTALAIAGTTWMWRAGDRRHALFLLGWLGFYFVAHSYVLPSEVEMQARYHLHLAPPLLLLAAPALVRLWEEHRRWAWAALAYVAIAPLLHAGFIRDIGFNDMREYDFVRASRDLLPPGCTVLEFQGAVDHDVRFSRVGTVLEDGARRALFTVVPAASGDPRDPLRPRARELLTSPPGCLAYYEGLQCWGIKERDEPIAPACAALREAAPLEPLARTRFPSRPYDEHLSRGVDPERPEITLTLYRVLPHGTRPARDRAPDERAEDPR